MLVFDLEDSVPVDCKLDARLLVGGAVRRRELVAPFGGEVMVRINGMDTPWWREDLDAVVWPGLDGVRVPKVENRDMLEELDSALGELERRRGLEHGTVVVLPILETVKGVLDASAIASAPRVAALTLGGEDLTSDLGARRTPEGGELDAARSQVLLAARGAGVQAIDTVYPMVNDVEGLERECRKVYGLGFDGKSVIHPSQVAVIHRVFRPSDDEIRRAERIVEAAERAATQGAGAVCVDGRMVDVPVVRKARRVLALARRLGLGGGEPRNGG